MAYDEALAARVRLLIGGHPALSEKRMFGGIAFLIDGKMAVGVNKDHLMVRVGKEAHDEAVARPGAHIMDFTGRPMVGWIMVSLDGVASDEALAAWVQQGVSYAEGLDAA